MKELETRILDIDVNDIILKLNSIGAIKVKQENQINNIYDFNDKRLIKNKGYARIRTIEDMLNSSTHYFMTTKKLLTQDTFKVMEENETEVLNVKSAENIFKSLGLELIQSIKRYRESYKYNNTLIEIDINDKSFCPFPYIEIESPNTRELEQVVLILGYTMNDTNSQTIYEILEQLKK